MPQLNLTHAIAGRYAIWTEEKAICRRVARRSLGKVARAAFAATVGHEFTGSHDDRLRLASPERERVDRGIVKAMRRHPRAWRRSPVVARPVDRAETKNLILNQMLDQLGARTSNYSTFMGYCCLGTATGTPAVTDVGLGAEVVRTSTTLSTETTDDNPTRTRTFNRVFDFPAEGSTSFAVGERSGHNYTEVGLSYNSTAGNNLGTRALLTGGTVSVMIGQQARVSYSVSVTLPANATATPPVTGDSAGFGSSAGEMVYCTLNCISAEAQSGSVSPAISTNATKPTFGTQYVPANQVAASSTSFVTYVSGSYKAVRRGVWSLATGNRTDWRGIGFSAFASTVPPSFQFIFDAAKTKDSLHTLTIDLSITYGRA